MDKKDFFVQDNDIVELDIFGLTFKYKKVNADDELNWVDDYTVRVEKKDDKGKTTIYNKTDSAKLAKCKLRNIVGVPFDKTELNALCGIDKEYSEFSKEDKDLMLGKFTPDVFNALIVAIDETRKNKKKVSSTESLPEIKKKVSK